MSYEDTCYLSATKALKLFKRRKLSPVELMRAIIKRTEKVEPVINAFTETFFEEALAQARKSEARYMKKDGRTRALEGFKNGDVRVLVATDIAARGIDIDQLPLVVNHDLPDVPHDYVHRIGRTGRAGRDGQAISLVAPDEIGLLRSIERLVNQRIAPQVLPGYEPSPHAVHAQPDSRPPMRGRPQQGAGRRPARGPRG